MPTKPTGRPRGRPKGSKNTPTLEVFLAESLAAVVTPPAPKPKRHPGPWAGMTAEERSAYARKIAAKRKVNTGGRGYPLKPRSMKLADFEAHMAREAPIIKRIMKKMADNGQLPDDPRAVQALEAGVTILRAPVDAKTKLAAARLILDFTKAKPTAKVEHTIKSAEEYLDEIAEDDEA